MSDPNSRLDVDELRTRMETIIFRESEDFFDAAEDRATVEVTIRICCEFYDFLMETKGDVPDRSDAHYMVGTIRSGMDEYFTMEQWGRILSGLRLQEGFTGKLPGTFAELKTSYVSTFEEVLACQAGAQAFGLLLSLVRMMLLFLAVYFQSYLSYAPDESSSGTCPV